MVRIVLAGEANEIADKGERLVHELVNRLAPVSPAVSRVSEILEKALRVGRPLKYRVLQEMHDRERVTYVKHVKAMSAEIVRVLERSENSTLKKTYDHTKEISDKDTVAYRRIKEAFLEHGYDDTDFKEGGVLFGLSTDDLLELLGELGQE